MYLKFNEIRVIFEGLDDRKALKMIINLIFKGCDPLSNYSHFGTQCIVIIASLTLVYLSNSGCNYVFEHNIMLNLSVSNKTKNIMIGVFNDISKESPKKSLKLWTSRQKNMMAFKIAFLILFK